VTIASARAKRGTCMAASSAHRSTRPIKGAVPTRKRLPRCLCRRRHQHVQPMRQHDDIQNPAPAAYDAGFTIDVILGTAAIVC
jgi:hypothetical protein